MHTTNVRFSSSLIVRCPIKTARHRQNSRKDRDSGLPAAHIRGVGCLLYSISTTNCMSSVQGYTMEESNKLTIEIRERWLPLVQQVAEIHGWTIRGRALESFVDAVVPYLAQPEIISTISALHVLENYYNDAPLIEVLSAANDQSAAIWKKLLAQISHGTLRTRFPADTLAAIQQRAEADLRAVLQQHSYQVRLASVFEQVLWDMQKALVD